MRALNDSLCVGDGLFVGDDGGAVVMRQLIVCDLIDYNTQGDGRVPHQLRQCITLADAQLVSSHRLNHHRKNLKHLSQYINS